MLRTLSLIALLLACELGAAPALKSAAIPATPVARTEAYLAAAAAAAPANPTNLTYFLAEIPKGADLHHHLTGAVYAESYIQYAAEDGDCFDPTFAIVAPPCDPSKGLQPAALGITDYLFRNLAIDALSARNYAPVQGDASILVHFFRTFFKFDLVTNGHWPQEFAEVIHRAALQHEVYLETMLSPDKFKSLALGDKVGWDDDFDRMRAKLDAAGVPALVAESRKNLDAAEAGERKLLGCNGPAPDIGCALTVRYIHQILRDEPKQQVFAQIQTAFELANVDPRVVSVNPVQPQDDYLPMNDFELHMRMFGYFHKLYPKIHLTMHAGELFPGVGKPEDMENPSHIRDTIEIGGAERIGHGLDVLYERDPRGLLAMMKRKHILVEDPIYIHEMLGPGVVGGDLLPIYVGAGVPVSLATDDEGGARSNLTQTFLRAVQGYHIDYYGLKKMVRDSLEHGFMGGADLWSVPEGFDHMVPACTGVPLTAQPASAACRAFLAGSLRAAIEWKEEVAFARFEARF
jgi:adenosine deaminase